MRDYLKEQDTDVLVVAFDYVADPDKWKGCLLSESEMQEYDHVNEIEDCLSVHIRRLLRGLRHRRGVRDRRRLQAQVRAWPA